MEELNKFANAFGDYFRKTKKKFTEEDNDREASYNAGYIEGMRFIAVLFTTFLKIKIDLGKDEEL